jgi:hypothetical protein
LEAPGFNQLTDEMKNWFQAFAFKFKLAPLQLDCVFNILGKTCCVLAEDVIGADKPFRRTVVGLCTLNSFDP